MMKITDQIEPQYNMGLWKEVFNSLLSIISDDVIIALFIMTTLDLDKKEFKLKIHDMWQTYHFRIIKKNLYYREKIIQEANKRGIRKEDYVKISVARTFESNNRIIEKSIVYLLFYRLRSLSSTFYLAKGSK